MQICDKLCEVQYKNRNHTHNNKNRNQNRFPSPKINLMIDNKTVMERRDKKTTHIV